MTSTAFDLISLIRPATRPWARRCKIQIQPTTARPIARIGIQRTITAHQSEVACLTGWAGTRVAPRSPPLAPAPFHSRPSCL